MTKKVIALHIQELYHWDGIMSRNAKFTPETWGELDETVATLLKNRENIHGRELDDQWQEVKEQIDEARYSNDGEVEESTYKEYSSTRGDGESLTVSLEHEDGTYTHLEL